MSLNLFYITNNPDVAQIAERYGVDRIWIDLEVLGKDERQKNMNTVKSHHTIADIKLIKSSLSISEVLVRINPWNENSICEIDEVVNAGADIIMLPMWKSRDEVEKFIGAVNNRCKTTLLLETKEAVQCIDDILNLSFNEIHIGLNDLHLSYGLVFMFELLSDGTVEMLCEKFRKKSIPFGFGGIAKLCEGLLPAQNIIMEHYRLGSSRVILSRSFCDTSTYSSIEEVENVFSKNLILLRNFELTLDNTTEEEFMTNKEYVSKCVNKIVESKRRVKDNES